MQTLTVFAPMLSEACRQAVMAFSSNLPAPILPTIEDTSPLNMTGLGPSFAVAFTSVENRVVPVALE